MASKVRLAAGLDLGSTNTRMVICALENEGLRFLGWGEAPSTGWSRGKLHDQQALTESVRFAMQEAERRAQVSPETVVSRHRRPQCHRHQQPRALRIRAQAANRK